VVKIEQVQDVVGEANQEIFNLYGNLSWVIWENIEFTDKEKNNEVDWESKVKKVAWFSDIISFHQAWNLIPHSQVKELLYKPSEGEFKIFQDKDENKFIVGAIQMFKDGILPAWEDPVNKNGSEYRIDIPKYSSEEVIQNIWQ
jgi:hypothetical protein